METDIQQFLVIYTKYIFRGKKVFEVGEITAQMVHDSFSQTAESAGSLDGWNPKEMSLLSLEVCAAIATMLNQIEAGAPWPRSSPHARIAYPEKVGAVTGMLMSYRPLTITAPIYRCWATMRLACMEDWMRTWALPEMYARIPEMGAVDAWRQVLATIEDFKLEGKPYCGGVADIAKFFD